MIKLEPENWIANYADYLLSFAMFRINNILVCEDLVQETFLSAWKAKNNFKGNSSEKTWLTSILKNKIIDEYRKKSRNIIVENEKIENTFFEEGIIAHWKKENMPQSWDPIAIDKMISKEYYEILHKCITKLSEHQAALLQEKYFEESKSEKICKDFNITKSNYWITMHRINLQLRKCIESNWIKK